MKKKLLPVYILLCGWNQLFSQNKIDSASQANIDTYYKLAIQFKDGKGVTMDYDSAFQYFSKAAALGDPQSEYALGYLFYKGLGCKQNYDTAARYFYDGAILGKDNSLYFYSLCWRNGYGRPKNEDSAIFYLKKSADLGYRQALMELEAKGAENSNDSAAQALLQKLHNAAIVNNNQLNHFSKIQPHISSKNVIAGTYSGWIIQYDWSGSHMVSIKKLELNLAYNNKTITGEWVENDQDTAKLNATLVGDSVVFSRTNYGRTDHYSPSSPIKYNFQSAKLNLVQAGDSIFLAGNVEMFSPVRGEPSKPLFIAVARPGLNNLDSIFLKNLALNAFPNPFKNVLNVQFNILKADQVEVQIYDINGLQVYRNYAGNLQEGFYSLPVSGLRITSGVYILKLMCGNHVATLKVIRE